VTPIGLTGVGPLGGLAWDDATLTMYAVDVSGPPLASSLYAVNLVTGAATLIGATGVQLGRRVPTRGRSITCALTTGISRHRAAYRGT
jgi:hypothetical protein